MNLLNLLKRRKPPEYSIGIDFGTTYSRLSYVENSRRFYVPPKVSPIRSALAPETRAVDGHEELTWYVGDYAIDTSWDHYSRFKLEIGQTVGPDGTMRELRIKSEEPGKDIIYRPEILAARLMWVLFEKGCDENTALGQFHDVTVTVPAQWNALRRQATIHAARIAGFVNVQLIEEPVAAFLAINEFHPGNVLRKAKHILVFDFGGGTLDITVIYRPDPDALPYVIGRAMDKGAIAGEAIDEKLAERIIGTSQWEGLSKRDKKCLANKVKGLKEALNPKDLNGYLLDEAPLRAPFILPDSRISYERGELRLKYDDMEKIVDPIAEKAVDYVRRAIESARRENPSISRRSIDVVLLVGGSSYLHGVRDAIASDFAGMTWDKEIILEEPEAVVAMGAAMYQSALDRGVELFRPRCPMRTYLEYKTRERGIVVTKPKDLGTPLEFLPIAPLAPPPIPVLRGETAIYWEVKQAHTYSTDSPDVVEHVLFKDYDGRPDRVRVEYEIDLNGCLRKWKPSLIFQQNRKPETGCPRRYDWADKDPTKQARDFLVDRKPADPRRQS